MKHITASALALALCAASLLSTHCAPGTSETDSESDTESESTDSDTEGGDLCSEPDEALSASYTIDHGDWPLDFEGDEGGAPSSLEIAGDCVVTDRQDDGPLVRLELQCSQDPVLDLPISITLQPPLQQDVPVLEGAAVTLRYRWNSDGHHVAAGSAFALHDAGAGALLVAGVDSDSLSAPDGTFAPLALERVDGVCAPTCFDGTPGCAEDSEERLAIAVTHEGDAAAVEILDGQGDVLDAGDTLYRISVVAAKSYTCINCWPDYQVLILGEA